MKKFVRFSYNNQVKYGIVSAEGIFELKSNYLFSNEKNGLSYGLNDIKVLSPCEPSKIVCVGLNYLPDNKGMEIPETPLIFMKPSTSIIGPEEIIVKWPMVRELTYEGELAVVIGKEAHKIKVEDVEKYIFGYTVANDVTARDLQKKDGQWTRAKSFNTFLPLGPVIVQNIDLKKTRIQTRLNNKICQDGRVQNMIFSIPYLISYISDIMTLLPGDVVLTGTPGGYGGLMNPGDKVEIEIDGIGKLLNYVGED